MSFSTVLSLKPNCVKFTRPVLTLASHTISGCFGTVRLSSTRTRAQALSSHHLGRRFSILGFGIRANTGNGNGFVNRYLGTQLVGDDCYNVKISNHTDIIFISIDHTARPTTHHIRSISPSASRCSGSACSLHSYGFSRHCIVTVWLDFNGCSHASILRLSSFVL